MQVKHRFISNVPDDPAADAAGQVLPSHWNQDHEFFVEPFSLVGNDGATSSPAKAIAVNNGLRLFAGALGLLGVPVFFQPTEPEEAGPFVWVSPDAQTGLSLRAKDEAGQTLQLEGGGGGGSDPGTNTFTGTFTGPVAAFKVVQRGSGSYALASSDDPQANSRPVGITITAGTTASIQFAGRITNPEWSFVDGQRLFLGVDGELTSDPFTGVVTQQIGIAQGANSIFLTPSVGVRRA